MTNKEYIKKENFKILMDRYIDYRESPTEQQKKKIIDYFYNLIDIDLNTLDPLEIIKSLVYIEKEKLNNLLSRKTELLDFEKEQLKNGMDENIIISSSGDTIIFIDIADIEFLTK